MISGVFLAPTGRGQIRGGNSNYPYVKVKGAVDVFDDLELKGVEFIFDPVLKNAAYAGMTFPQSDWQVKRGTYKISQ